MSERKIWGPRSGPALIVLRCVLKTNPFLNKDRISINYQKLLGPLFGLMFHGAKIQSLDGEVFDIEEHCLRQSQFLSLMCENRDQSAMLPIPLRDKSCTSEVLKIVLGFLHNSDPLHHSCLENSRLDKDEKLVLKVFRAAQYLDIPTILACLVSKQNILHNACADGCADTVRSLVELKADVTKRNSSLKTPIEMAVNSACKEELMRGEPFAQGWTQLMVAVSIGNRALIKSRLRLDKVDAANLDGLTALIFACQRGDTKSVKLLLRAKCSVDKNSKQGSEAIRIALDGGRLAILRALIAAHADPASALKSAAKAGQANSVDALVAARADVNACSGGSPLALAAEGGHELVVSTLLRAKADTSIGCYLYPLQTAAARGHVDLVRALLRARACVNAHTDDVYGRAALHSAAEQGQSEVIRVLVSARADVNGLSTAFWQHCRTPLYYAAEAAARRPSSGAADAVQALLAASARVDVRMEDGRTPMDAAEHSPEVLVLLRAAAARQVPSGGQAADGCVSEMHAGDGGGDRTSGRERALAPSLARRRRRHRGRRRRQLSAEGEVVGAGAAANGGANAATGEAHMSSNAEGHGEGAHVAGDVDA